MANESWPYKWTLGNLAGDRKILDFFSIKYIPYGQIIKLRVVYKFLNRQYSTDSLMSRDGRVGERLGKEKKNNNECKSIHHNRDKF